MASLPDLFATLRAVLAENWPGRTPLRIAIYTLEDHEPISLPIPGASTSQALFVPDAFQRSILAALNGKALKTDALGAVVGDRSRLYRRPGGIHELREQGLVEHHPRLGYYRPDAPPSQLAGEPGE